MLRYAVFFLVIAAIAAILGFGGIAAVFGFGGTAAGATELAKILCYVFLLVTAVLFVLSLLER